MKKKQYKAVFRARIDFNYDESQQNPYTQANHIIWTNIQSREFPIPISQMKLSG